MRIAYGVIIIFSVYGRYSVFVDIQLSSDRIV